MFRSSVSLGSLAASTAVLCVLSLMSPTTASGGGFIDPATAPLEQAAGYRVAQATEPAEDTGKGKDDAPPARPTEREPSAETPPAPDAGKDEFSGSAEPAGPDLTAGQEGELISRGWK